MSVPTFPCPSGEICFAPECCAHRMCMHFEMSATPYWEDAPEQVAADPEPQQAQSVTMADFFPADYEAEISDREIIDFVEGEARRYAVLCGAEKEYGWDKPVLGAPSYLPFGDSLWIYPTFREAVKAAIREKRTPLPPLDETEVCF